MTYTMTDVVLLFFAYSVVGWLWETIYCSIRARKFQYRGFLAGPYCPVYGFAVVTILLATDQFSRTIIGLFIIGLIVATIFEFFASIILERAFHLKLWDYSQLWGNLDGRVAPAISLFWGIAVVILVKFVQPPMMNLVNWIEAHTDKYAALVIAFVMSVDTIVTVLNTQQFRQHAAVWEQRIAAENERLHIELLDDLANQRLNQAKRRQRLLQLVHPNWNERRFLHNYPQLNIREAPHLKQLRKQLSHAVADLKAARKNGAH